MSEHYFSVQHCLSISVIPMEPDFVLPALSDLDTEIPEAFKIANTIVHLDLSNTRSLRNINEDFSMLVEVINQQAKKINLLMAYILLKEEDEQHHHFSTSFGGSEVTFLSELKLDMGQTILLKLFLRDEASAVYCYGKVIGIDPEQNKCGYTVEYSLIRDDDRELLIRACLNQQSKQLRERAAQKYNQQ